MNVPPALQGRARTRVRLNGRHVIEFGTNDMLFGVVDFPVPITRYIALYPGDVLWMGTDGESENRRLFMALLPCGNVRVFRRRLRAVWSGHI